MAEIFVILCLVCRGLKEIGQAQNDLKVHYYPVRTCIFFLLCDGLFLEI